MANPNNLIRPSVLETGPQPAPQARSSASSENRPNVSAELAEFISDIVMRTINARGRQLFQEIASGNDQQQFLDQAIYPEFRQNITDLDKVPDVVKSLREFSGRQNEFSSWKKSIERVLNIYESSRGTPKYFGILNTIRNKITGNADIVLESYNTPLNWEAIAKCLTAHYADKRDLGTLEYQMTSLVQGQKTIQEFYQEVYSHLSLILNNVSCMNISVEAVKVLTDNYRNKALDTFIRGLSGDLPRLLGMKEPTDLPQALQLCLKLQNQNFRSQYAYNRHNSNQRQQLTPPRQNRTEYNRNNYQQRFFFPELAYLPQIQERPNIPQYQQNHYQPNHYQQNHYQLNPYQQLTNYQQPNTPRPFQQNYAPPRPTAPKPQPKPTPMEVDSSIRTNMINYANRPQYRQVDKRPPGSIQGKPPYKVQRNYHIQTAQDIDQETEIRNPQYSEEQANNDNFEFQDVSDIHFLE